MKRTFREFSAALFIAALLWSFASAVYFAPTVEAASLTPRKRALLVGISDYPQSSGFPEIDYPKNDVARVSELLKAYGFEVTKLTDSPADVQPTRQNILDAIRKVLIEDAKTGDIAVFYYSGHGASVVNKGSDEPDKRDETIVPKDAARPRIDPVKFAAMTEKQRLDIFNSQFRDIRDKELVDLFNQALDKGVRLTVIFDSCHSGSAARGDEQSKEVEPVELDINVAPTKAQLTKPESRGALILTAARDYQVAGGGTYELNGQSARYSHFTAALLNSLYETPADLVSADELFQELNARMESDGRTTQTAAIDGLPDRLGQTLFGGAARRSTGRLTAQLGMDRGTPFLRAGLANGLSTGDELRRIVTATGKETATPRTIRVKKAGIDKSEVEIVGTVDDLVPEQTFEQVRWARAKEPDLTIWIPPLTLSDAELTQLTDGLKKAPPGAVVTDPIETSYSKIAFLDAVAGKPVWRAGVDRRTAVTIGPRLDLASLSGGTTTKGVSRIFVNVPPTASLRAQLVKTFGAEGRRISLVTDRTAAQYELIGRYDPATGKVEYAWMLRSAAPTDNNAVKGNLKEPDASAPSLPPITEFIDGGGTTAVPDLLSLVQKLGKIRGLINLSSPPSLALQKFPYRLQVIDPAGKAVGPNGILDASKRYDYVLQRVRNTAEVLPHFFVYLVDIDSNGASQYVEVEFGAGRGESSRPFNFENTLKLMNCPVDPKSLGTENILLLVTETRLSKARGFKFPGVRRSEYETRGADPLNDLLSDVGEVQSRGNDLTPDTWTMQHLILRSANPLKAPPLKATDSCHLY
ncbi:MAG TPA: caspase family protein [Pyrinomonadaceae bacterium]|jgi:hypothetical protein|nr:caspase family protein [Pyrinomonadaceae bacterium]